MGNLSFGCARAGLNRPAEKLACSSTPPDTSDRERQAEEHRPPLDREERQPMERSKDPDPQRIGVNLDAFAPVVHGPVAAHEVRDHAEIDVCVVGNPTAGPALEEDDRRGYSDQQPAKTRKSRWKLFTIRRDAPTIESGGRRRHLAFFGFLVSYLDGRPKLRVGGVHRRATVPGGRLTGGP